MCLVCLQKCDRVIGVACQHVFCPECWSTYLQFQVHAGLSTGQSNCLSVYLSHYLSVRLFISVCPCIYVCICACPAIECMSRDCHVLVDEHFVLTLLTNSILRIHYQEFTFSDHVKVCLCLFIYRVV